MNAVKFTVPDLDGDNESKQTTKFSSGSLFKSHRVEIQSNILQSKSPSKTSTDTKSATSSANAASSSTLNNIDTPVKVAGTSNLLVPKAKSDEAHNIYTDSSIKNTSHTLSSAPFMNAVTNQPDCTPESPKKPTNTSTSLIISLRQRGNPIIKFIRNVPWEFGDIVPDYQMGKAMCALYLSLRYHHLNPAYIHERLKQLGRMYDLRVLLVQVDVKDPHHSLKELAKISILSDVSLILAFSPEEAGRYLETYKAYENKPPDLIMEKTESNFLAQFTDCVTSTRKVNKTDATTLLTTFGNFEHIAEAGEEDLSLCPGFGPQKAKRLHDVLHEPFLKAKKKKEDSTKSSGGSSTKTSTSATALKSPMKQYLSKEKTS